MLPRQIPGMAHWPVRLSHSALLTFDTGTITPRHSESWTSRGQPLGHASTTAEPVYLISSTAAGDFAVASGSCSRCHRCHGRLSLDPPTLAEIDPDSNGTGDLAPRVTCLRVVDMLAARIPKATNLGSRRTALGRRAPRMWGRLGNGSTTPGAQASIVPLGCGSPARCRGHGRWRGAAGALSRIL
jgi:hypothetical protein